MADFGRRKCTQCTCVRNSRLEQRDIFRDGEEGRIMAVHISAKNEWAGHSEANTAAVREVGESRVTTSVRAQSESCVCVAQEQV